MNGLRKACHGLSIHCQAALAENTGCRAEPEDVRFQPQEGWHIIKSQRTRQGDEETQAMSLLNQKSQPPWGKPFEQPCAILVPGVHDYTKQVVGCGEIEDRFGKR
ncbi:MAG: hypothetical protein NZM31_13735 [Gemmatales bacterium]|nr:hypothetical protein [Gemmatales bacterium]MDW8388057.1 hypothetical protein [Gemmatales bacterium]